MYKQSLFAIAALGVLTSNSLAADKLDDVVVTAKSNQSISNTAGSVTVITAEDIKKLNATNVKDALVKSAGITVRPAGTQYGRQGISIRGSQSDHVLILVDGKKVSGSDTNILNSDYQYSWVPMNNIERIEVIKGAASSLYGSEAIGGVINIITKKSDEKFYGDIDFKLGTSSDKGGSSKELAFNIGGKVSDNLSVSLSAERKDIDVSEKNNTTYIEGKEYTNGTVRVTYDIDDTQSLSASYTGGQEDRLHIGDELYYDISRKSYDISYTKEFEDISLKLDYYTVESENEYVSRDTNHELKNDTFKAEVDIETFDNNYIVLGAEHKKERYDDNSKNFTDKQTTKSYYIQDEIEVSDDVILTLGARYDDHEVFGGELSPKANIVYKLSKNQRLKFGYGEGFMAPGLKENSSNYLYTAGYGITVTGNPDLKPESSRNYEIGYEYYLDNGHFKFNVFKNDVKNLIQFSSLGGRNYTYANVDNSVIKGAELEFDYDINENHNILINYTHLDAKDKDDNEKLTYRPENSANIILNSELPFDISSTFSINYTGKQYDGTENLSGYVTSNVQLSKTIINDLTLRVGMDNIGDNRLDSDNSNTPGRFTYVGLNYKF